MIISISPYNLCSLLILVSPHLASPLQAPRQTFSQLSHTCFSYFVLIAFRCLERSPCARRLRARTQFFCQSYPRCLKGTPLLHGLCSCMYVQRQLLFWPFGRLHECTKFVNLSQLHSYRKHTKGMNVLVTMFDWTVPSHSLYVSITT